MALVSTSSNLSELTSEEVPSEEAASEITLIQSSFGTTRKNSSPVHQHFIRDEKTNKWNCKYCR